MARRALSTAAASAAWASAGAGRGGPCRSLRDGRGALNTTPRARPRVGAPADVAGGVLLRDGPERLHRQAGDALPHRQPDVAQLLGPEAQVAAHHQVVALQQV